MSRLLRVYSQRAELTTTEIAMPAPIITIDNALSRVTGITSPEMGRLRRLISYRAKDLPPVEVQKMIKAFDRSVDRRMGVDLDTQRFLRSGFRERLEDMGWAERLTPRVYGAVIYQRGVWDGWKTLISSTGVFGTGLLPHVHRALTLRLGKAMPMYTDQRVQPPFQPRTHPQVPDLYGFQRDSLNAWYAAGGRGVLDLPPRSGKTRIAIAACAETGLPTLIVVPTVGLVGQTVDRFSELGWSRSDVIGLTGGKPTTKTRRAMTRASIWVATPGTAAGPKPKKKSEIRKGLWGIETRKFLIIDEFHHSAADTWQLISIAAANAFYRMGLTGTHYRADGRDLAMHAVLSRAVYSRSVEEMVALGRLVPARVGMVRIAGYARMQEGKRLYSSGISQHNERNMLLVRAAQCLMRHGKRVLVLTREVEHARTLAHEIGTGCVQVDGADNSQVTPALRDLEAGRVRCVVGTSVIGEGRDVPAADALVYAAGGKSKVQVVQNYFRVLTQSAGKSHGVIIDCADNHHDRLVAHAAQRLALYRRCFTAEVLDAAALETWIGRAI